MTDEPLKLFIVCYQDDDHDTQDQFVTAYTAEEAFAMWRVNMAHDPADYENNSRAVHVFEVPSRADKPKLHSWYNGYDASEAVFDMSLVTLTTQAVEATFVTTTTVVGVTDDLSVLRGVVPDGGCAGA